MSTTEPAPPVLMTIDAGVATIVLNRPGRLNAIDDAMLDALDAALVAAEAAGDVRCVVVTGAGRAFCAGADLTSALARADDPVALASFVDRLTGFLDRLSTSRLPSIAAVRGTAVAGGFELLQACDLVVVAQDAHLADGHAAFGLLPAGGGTQRLPRLVGTRRALWLLMSGEPIAPDDALAAGLVNVVAPAADVDATALAMARRIAGLSPLVAAAVKEAVRRGLLADTWPDAMAVERELVERHMASRDVRIGIAAFLGKTTPTFVGE